jgi:hypothetical protein
VFITVRGVFGICSVLAVPRGDGGESARPPLRPPPCATSVSDGPATRGVPVGARFSNRLGATRVVPRRLAVSLTPADATMPVVQRAEWLPVPSVAVGLLTVVGQDLLESLYKPGTRYREVRLACDELAPDGGDMGST